MKKILQFGVIVAAFMISFGWTLVVQAYFPHPTGFFVNDYAEVISDETENSLEGDLADFENRTSTEIVIVTMRTLDGLDPFTYSQKVFTQWKIGKKSKDNGILFLIEAYSGKIFINVGKGLEGIMPDSVTGSLLRKDIIPFQKGTKDYSAAVRHGVDRIMEITQDAFSNSLIKKESTQFEDTFLGKILMVIVGVILFVPAVLFGIDMTFLFESEFWLWIIGAIISLYLVTFLGKSKSYWLGGIVGVLAGFCIGWVFSAGYAILIPIILLGALGLFFDYAVSKYYAESGLDDSFSLLGPFFFIIALIFGGRGGGSGGSSKGGRFGGGSSGGGGAGSH